MAPTSVEGNGPQDIPAMFAIAKKRGLVFLPWGSVVGEDRYALAAAARYHSS